MTTVHVIDTRVANIASMRVALERLDAKVEIATSSAQVLEADYVVLPGVGSFAAGMNRIDELGIAESMRNRVNANRPTLAVCLGLQLFCRSSEESPNTDGLGIVDATVERFQSTLKVPQLGWNDVTPSDSTTAFFETGTAYFANSFCVRNVPSDWSFATTNYGGEFISSFWRDNILCCQFHPELSGVWGLGLMNQWLGRSIAQKQGDSKC